MSAALAPSAARLEAMTVAHLNAVVALEESAYPFPWSRGNFIDSLAAGYLAEVLLDPLRQLVGYYVAMHGVEETHLLNITVAPGLWGHGHGRRLLDRVVARAQAMRSRALWLEVRQSNGRARQVYERYGFVQVGLRRGYYPAAQGQREDAIVMSLRLAPVVGEGHGLD
ncbi:MAG: ribosomal protein S18-alanine N-acetyltransferase [Pseudomonadota bacterium]